MSRILLIFTLLLLPACQSLKRPSSDPAKMSSDTLCYRASGAKKNEAITDEIRARGLDCRSILEDDPLLHPRRY